MIALLTSVGWNTLAAIGLAVAVLIAGRVWKRPELIHVLWVVVLVKLVTPGLITIDAIPAPVEQPVVVSAPVALPGTSVAVVGEMPIVAPSIPWVLIVFVAWVAGSVLFLGTAIVRVRRFLSALQVTVPPDPELLRSIESLAWRMHVQPRPRVRVVDAAVSPMVWGGLGGATLILPMKLMRELDAAERETLLAHELAHLKRGDCWIRWIELAVTSALWWNPVVWWVRRNLRRAEEQACDRWVLELLPRAQRAYADGIVKTVEFLAGHQRTPALATGATGTRHIQERLTMILAPSRPGRLRRPMLPALVLALLALPVIPGFADRGDSRDDDKSKARAELHELEQEALELELRLHDIQRKREEVEGRLELGRFKRDAAEMSRQMAERQLRDRDMAMREAELAEQHGHKEQLAQHLATVQAEVLQRMELVSAEIGQVEGDQLRDLERQLEELSRTLEDIAIELGRVGTARRESPGRRPQSPRSTIE